MSELPPPTWTPATNPVVPEKPRKRWPIYVGIGVAVFAILGVIGAVTGAGDNDDPATLATSASTTAEPATTVPEATEPPATTEPAPTTTEAPETTPAPTTAPPTTPPPTEPPTTPATTPPPTEPKGMTDGAFQLYFSTVHSDDLTDIGTYSALAGQAATDYDIDGAVRYASKVASLYQQVADDIEGISPPGSFGDRTFETFRYCEGAWDGAAEALADFDTDAISASTDDIDTCSAMLDVLTAELG